jgi:alpha-L-fucosidase 2
MDASRQRIEIYLNGKRMAGEGKINDLDEAFEVSRAYTLQHWIQACAGRGAYPIKFNGSLFTVDAMDVYWKFPEGRYCGPDYRRWGGPYWFQNTRLIYWPMLYSGDFDQMVPLFNMYRNMLPLLKERTRRYFGHDGVYFSETTQMWGLNRETDFGKNNPGFYPTNGYMKYNWDCGLELSTMLLAYYQHTQDEAFVKETLLPIADQVVIFYEQHYKRDNNGKLHISPSQALETWHTAEDPVTVLAGLRVVLAGLLALPESLTAGEQRERWKRVLGEVKDLPIAEEDGKKWVKPAHVFSEKRNAENSELYAIFPYPVYGVGKPDLKIGLETYARRENKRTGGWQQDAIQAALLGQTQDAKTFLLQNITTENLMGGVDEKANRTDSRFPAFWGPNFDWLPDQCNGSVIISTLQYMLMQTDGKKIILLPAWPKDWNASFKLHAPYQTTVEGRVVNGEVVDLKVTPKSRRKDVIIIKAKQGHLSN